MKHKAKSSRIDELRREYRRADFPKGFIRGKYAIPRGTDVSQEIYANGINPESVSDVSRAGLRLLEERAQKIGALRQALIEAEDSGQVGELDIQETRRKAHRRRRSGE
jgi:putative addiction module CopG family antidote